MVDETYKNGAMGVVADCFRNIREVQVANARKIEPGPVADTLDDIARALRSGLDPEQVALVCEAAAKAYRDPKAAKRIRAAVTRILEEKADND